MGDRMPKPELELIAKTLREARDHKDWSLRDVEAESKVSNSYLAQVEKALVKPSPDVLLKLADAYDIPYHLLMERAGYVRPEDETPNRDKVPAFVFSAAEVFDDDDWEMAQQFFAQLEKVKRLRAPKE